MKSTSPALPSSQATTPQPEVPRQPLSATKAEPVSDVAGSLAAAHDIERTVMHCLQNHPRLRFSRLDVHRYNVDTICLEGFLESNVDNIDICEVVRGIHGIKQVVNRVMSACPNSNVPKKG